MPRIFCRHGTKTPMKVPIFPICFCHEGKGSSAWWNLVYWRDLNPAPTNLADVKRNVCNEWTIKVVMRRTVHINWCKVQPNCSAHLWESVRLYNVQVLHPKCTSTWTEGYLLWELSQILFTELSSTTEYARAHKHIPPKTKKCSQDFHQDDQHRWNNLPHL